MAEILKSKKYKIEDAWLIPSIVDKNDDGTQIGGWLRDLIRAKIEKEYLIGPVFQVFYPEKSEEKEGD